MLPQFHLDAMLVPDLPGQPDQSRGKAHFVEYRRTELGGQGANIADGFFHMVPGFLEGRLA